MKNFSIIPSDEAGSDGTGWRACRDAMPALAARELDPMQELRILHRLASSGVELGPSPMETPNVLADLVLLGRRDAAKVLKEIGIELVRQCGPKESEKSRQLFGRLLLDRNFTRAAVQPTFLRRGHTRQLGRRTINGTTTTVHGFHTITLGGGKNFVGLGKNVAAVFEQLCDQFKLLIANSDGDLTTGLQAASFMRLVGCVLLHPFWDGNKRAFNAQTMLALRRMDIRVSTQPIGEHLHQDDFSGASNRLRTIFFERNAGIRPLTDNEEKRLHFEPDFFDRYMRQVEIGITEAIRCGISPTGPYFGAIEEGVEVIEDWIVKDNPQGLTSTL